LKKQRDGGSVCVRTSAKYFAGGAHQDDCELRDIAVLARLNLISDDAQSGRWSAEVALVERMDFG